MRTGVTGESDHQALVAAGKQMVPVVVALQDVVKKADLPAYGAYFTKNLPRD